MKKSSTLPILLAASIILSLMGCSAPSSDASEAEGELQLSEVAPEETGEAGETEETTSAEGEETTDSSASESGDAITETTVTVNGKAAREGDIVSPDTVHYTASEDVTSVSVTLKDSLGYSDTKSKTFTPPKKETPVDNTEQKKQQEQQKPAAEGEKKEQQ